MCGPGLGMVFLLGARRYYVGRIVSATESAQPHPWRPENIAEEDELAQVLSNGTDQSIPSFQYGL